MYNSSENPHLPAGSTRRGRRSAVRKIVTISPERVGFKPRRKHNLVWGWILGLGGVAGASFFSAGLVLIGSLIFGALAVVNSYAASLPPAEQLATVRVDQSTKIYDRNGNLLYEVVDPKGGRRTIVPMDQIPDVVIQATLATEDPTFYTNPGVDVAGLARAFYGTFVQGRTIGGSTITQQIVKNNLLSSEVTFDRKIREAMLSLEVTQKYSKDEILSAYLNTIPYGNLSYGIQAASQAYFGKNANDLNLAEASLLSGLPQSPARYDPCIDVDAALNRQQDVLRLMNQNHYISTEQIDSASAEMDQYLHSEQFARQCHPPLSDVAPHFVDYVRQELEKRYGTDVVYKGGLQVYTSLDPAVQKIAEDEVRKQIAGLKKQHVTDGAVVVQDPKTGEILAMVGSPNFFDQSIHGQVNMAVAPRQPGSSIKPFNYLAALRKGWTAATPILDAPTRFNQRVGEPPYIPVNYDGKFHGIVNVRYAIQNSLNVPAVRTLYFVTVPGLVDMEQQLGVTTLNDPNRFGLSLTLGGGDVPLVEHTNAFSTFPNYGKHIPSTPFVRILDGQGQTLYDVEKNPPQGQQVVDPRLAYLMTTILTDNNSRIPEFGPASPLHLCADGTSACPPSKERPAGAKTGTTNDFRDNWTMGYTPELVVGVWVGNADNTQMINSTGITGAAPIWHNVMARIYKEIAPYNTIAPHPFVAPPGIVRATVCKESGLLPGDSCPASSRIQEWFTLETVPKVTDKFWSGGWGNTCIPGGKVPPENAKIDVKYTGDIPLFTDIVGPAQARGLPVGMTGLGEHCQPADNPGDNPDQNNNNGDSKKNKP